MTDHQKWLDRAKFLAIVKDADAGDDVAKASFDLCVEMSRQVPAPWADTDPLAAERYLAARGASLEAAAANGRTFEARMRALIGLSTGKDPQTFAEIADWIANNVDDQPPCDDRRTP